MSRSIVDAAACLLGFFVAVEAHADTATRFFPVQLQQDGRVTLTPSFTPDGNTLYFAQSDCSPIWQCPQRLRRSDRTSNGWSAPKEVALPKPGRVDWPNITPDGATLIFSWSARRSDLVNLDIDENFDLYTLDLTDPDARPQPIRSGDINRPRAGRVKTLRYVHNEALPSVTRSGSLYFMTERPDGIGERDIYRARRNADNTYATAVPLAAPINSPQRDDGVWVNAEETIMLLTYPNRGGSGGADLFISFGSGGDWGQPLNLGPQINSPYSDFGARLSPDGQTVLFTSDRPFANQARGLLQVWSAPVDIDALRRAASANQG